MILIIFNFGNKSNKETKSKLHYPKFTKYLKKYNDHMILLFINIIIM